LNIVVLPSANPFDRPQIEPERTQLSIGDQKTHLSCA